MISKIKKPVSILLSIIMVFSLFTIVPLSASAAYWYSNLTPGTLIQSGDTFSFGDIGSFKFADYNDPTIIHEVKGSDFSYNQATLSVTDGYYSFGSTKLLPTSVSPGGLLVADYDSTTKMATFGVQNITHSFDETTGTLTIGGSGVVPPNYAFTGSDVYGVVFTQSNLVKHLIIDATDMIAIKQNAFMAYTGGCVLEDVVITSTSSAPLTIENNAIFYEKDSAVTITVNAATLPTVTSCPVDNYSSPVNLIYNVEQPITFNKNALTNPSGYLTVTFPTHCNIFIPAGPQFTDSQLQEEYDMFAEYGDEEYFWRDHSDLVEGTDYVLGDARYEELTPLNASLVVGNYNTALFSAYTITDASVNGTVTASVNGTDVTEAEPDSTVLLTVAPDSGYQFKSITAIGAKYGVEEFSDLVALMGDAVFEAAEYADHTEHTCKAEDGKFVVYNGTTPVTELSESDITDVSGLSGNSPMITCGNIRWYFGVSDGKITSIEAVNTSSWDYLFESVYGSESTGTLPPADFALTTVTEGSQYSFTMQKRAVTVTAEFEEAPAPETFKVYVKKPTNETYTTIENLTGETTVAQLKEIIADQIDIPATAQRLIFAGKEILDDAKTLAECKIVDESTIHLVIRGYTVTWLNYDNSELGTTTVQYGSTPTYDGTPEKAEDENYTYTFAGWSPEVVAATADATYTATYTATAKPKDLFPQHSITLGGNIGVNFYIDSAAADFASDENAYVKFTWDNGTYNKEVKLKDLTTDADGYYKATVDVVAAQMAHKIHAEVYLNGAKLEQTDDYSVQDYAEAVYNNPGAYDNKGKPRELQELAKALLNYGAMAQTVFADSLNEAVNLPTGVVGVTDFSGVTADDIAAAIKSSASDLNTAAAAFDAEFYTSSLIYLSRNTLRLYFTPASKTVGALNGLDFSGNLSEYYYYVDVENIPAAELDNQQTFNVNGTEFTFSALDYAKAVVNSGMGDDQKNLAKALYLYNQKANAYFDDAPAPVENVVDLGTLQGDYEAQNNDVLTGVLSGDKKISIADGATITLRDANITLSSSAQYAGITPLGDATILLEETNTVKGGNRNYPGIYVPAGKTLIIDGTGSLNASSHGCGCGIGGGFEKAAGNTVINGGTITATGGEFAAGIGSGQYGSCGNITITGGTITANGGDDAAGIGSGDDGSCGNILITGGTVTANGRYTAAGIGSGYEATCGNITIADTVTQVTATKGKYSPNSIGAGDDGTCGTVTIAPGANVIQN